MSNPLDRRSVLAGLAALAGCAQGGGGAPSGGAAYTSIETAGPALPLDAAVRIAADRVLATTPRQDPRQPVIIDPLVDGVTGEQSAATQQIQTEILRVAQSSYPQFGFQPFSARAVARNPLVMVGTF